MPTSHDQGALPCPAPILPPRRVPRGHHRGAQPSPAPHLPPWLAPTGHGQGALPFPAANLLPNLAPTGLDQRPPPRPAVHNLATARASARASLPSSSTPPAAECANRPRPGHLACHVSPSAPACINPPRLGRAACHVFLSRPGVRALATTAASCVSRVPLAPQRARTSHDRGELPVRCHPPAEACANQPQLGRAACHVSPSHPGCGQCSVAPAVL